jgi:hypothetical protein
MGNSKEAEKEEKLKYEEKGILKYLGRGYEESINLKDITKYLNESDYVDDADKKMEFSIHKTRKMLDHLAETGYVRSKTEGKGSAREEKFYLAKGMGAGVRKRMQLQGRGFFFDPSRLVKRLTGMVFLLVGIGLFVYQSHSLTGAVIGTPTNDFIVGALFIFIGLAFFFFKPKKKEKDKKVKKRK